MVPDPARARHPFALRYPILARYIGTQSILRRFDMRRGATLGVCVLMTLAGCQTDGAGKPASTVAGAKAGAPADGAGAVRLVSGLGNVHHPVTTQSPEAQRYFDQGLAYCYAFNHAEAIRSFKRAAELDPGCAMAHWGEALALGPNINMDVDPEAEKAAFAAVTRAMEVARRPGMGAADRAYVAALSKRYSDDPKADLKKLAVDYKLAMGQLSKQYPDDLDAATLYAESAMDLRPWKLWTKDQKPEEGTQEIVAVLESVLKRDPNHLGANHFYIHAVEASAEPGRALGSAQRLPVIAPAAGHLVHMPAHVYIRTGDYLSAVRANQEATSTDERYFACCKPAGIYPLMYYNHNRHFLAVAACMSNQSRIAIEAADALGAGARQGVKEAPMVEPFATVPLLVRARFARWDELMATAEPDAKTLPSTLAAWHFARGMAMAAAGNAGSAREQLAKLREDEKAITAVQFGLNPASSVMAIGEHLLAGRIAAAAGDASAATAEYRKAVEAQDALDYDEPSAWPWPAREALGAALLRAGDAAAAESVFREDLRRNPNNPRSLLGLAASLKGKDGAAQAQAAAEAALKPADVKVTLDGM